MTSARSTSFVLDGTAESVSRGRRAIRLTVEGWVADGQRQSSTIADRLFAVELVASELLTNAVQHAGNILLLRLMWNEPSLRIEVQDERGDVLPQRRRSGGDDLGGRGLPLIEEYSSAWGWDCTDRGKKCWAEVTVHGPAAR